MPYQRRIRNGVQPEQVRAKIRGAYLIRRLQQHVAGKIKLTAEQVRSADILLRKIIPDLSQSSVTGEMTHKYVVEVPPLLTKDEWLKRYRTIEHKPERPTPPTIDATPMLPLPPPTKQ
jgi:hypothetical protein